MVHPRSSIAALAGRRVDAVNAKNARFPLENVDIVRARLAGALRAHRVIALVSSAACGADLLALDEAARLGIRRHIMLPFPVPVFREKSVTDRPGGWGPLYDRLVRDAQASGDLVVIDPVGGADDAAYSAANEAIIAQANALAERSDADRIAITVWEGRTRPGNDITENFKTLAHAAGFADVTVLTT